METLQIHVVRPLPEVMYSSCLSNTMAGKPIEVETIMTIWFAIFSSLNFLMK
jgi:hypothetical protein